VQREEFRQTVNQWGQHKVPFLFIVDFEMEKPMAIRLADISPDKLLYDVHGVTNAPAHHPKISTGGFVRHPITPEAYAEKFNKVLYHLRYGDSFLTNLTIKTKIAFKASLRDLFYASNARYKLWLKNECLVFSPEIFVQIKEGKIFSYPMKGTIDASIPGAASIILENKKEQSEHVTIVDLIRNDLSQVASKVEVTRFRYIEEIRTNHKNLLQVSSEIVGVLPEDYRAHLGDMLLALLPAGSVSGAPKPKTVAIIRQTEGEKRGYYTGVFGLFDGQNMDSGVMIRFIEQQGGEHYYRSGGGITTQSECMAEYEEAIDKVYVPVA
jgi:para-aminobenzoate synthetase component 1